MVFTVRCFKCGQRDVRLIMGGRSIIHAQCHGCGANLLAEVMEFEQSISDPSTKTPPPESPEADKIEDESSAASLEEDTTVG